MRKTDRVNGWHSGGKEIPNKSVNETSVCGGYCQKSEVGRSQKSKNRISTRATLHVNAKVAWHSRENTQQKRQTLGVMGE